MGLCTVHKLDEQTALALQAASSLEEELEAQIPPHAQASWCVRERIEPLLQGWVVHQLGLLRSWSSRILSNEDWRPVTAPRGYSRSAPPPSSLFLRSPRTAPVLPCWPHVQ